FARVFGRRYRRALDRQPLCAGERIGEDRCLLATRAAGGESFNGAPVYHSAVSWRDELRKSVFDASSDGEADRATDGQAGGVFAIEKPSALSHQPSGNPKKFKGVLAEC